MTARPYVIKEYVRWSDVDSAGIIFHGSYVRFFEIAETELFRHCGLAYKDVFDRYDVFLPRKAVHSEFFQPVRLDDHLQVAAYVGAVGTTSMTMHFEVTREGGSGLTASARMVLVCVDRQRLASVALPVALVRALAPHTLPPEAARAALGLAAP
jgi:YbgC/YbaW family acyl-CoA thioester hydrolase